MPKSPVKYCHHVSLVAAELDGRTVRPWEQGAGQQQATWAYRQQAMLYAKANPGF